MTELQARDTCRNAIERVHAFANADNFPTRLIREVRTRLDHLHTQWNRMQQMHAILLERAAADDVQRDHHLDILERAEELFLDADAIMNERIHEIMAPSTGTVSDRGDDSEENDHDGTDRQRNGVGPQQTPPPIAAAIPQPAVPLGNIPAVAQQLPWQFRIENIWGEFDGDRKKWPAFHDSFKSRVYDDLSLPAVQKFQILRAALKGKAAKSLGEWQIRDCNFEPAWQRLKQLYEDPYATSKELIQKIFSMRKLESPNGTRLQIMSNITQEVSRQLKALGYPAEHYDLLFIHSVHGKLDEKTSVQWDLQRQSDRPTLSDFTGFLDRQAKALSNAYCMDQAPKQQNRNDRTERKRPNGGNHNGDGKSYQSDSKRFKPNHSHSNYTAVKTEGTSCAMCPEDHTTRKCPKFLQLNLSKRKDKARSANLCYNCLSSAHAVKDCKSGKCNRCDKKHNSLLCPENPNNRQLNVNQAVAKKKPPKSKHNGKQNKFAKAQ